MLKNIFVDKDNKLNANLEDIEIDEEVQTPPTYLRTNEFTSAFQLVVDTYGIPHYREINPGYLSKGVLKMLIEYRYFILLLGFFSVFCGLLYNDFLSIPIYFKSCYPRSGEDGQHLEKDRTCNYQFGLDPVWMLASNELMFVNSLKMKLSVILGVSHMVLGIFLKGLNALFECDFIELLFIFFPEIILMLILFGYMDFLIFVKWGIDYKDKEYRAPDIKSFLMSIVLKFGELPSTGVEGEDWIFFTDRATLEKINRYILFGAVICIIVMLFPKMILKYCIAKHKYNKKNLKDIKNIAIINENEDEEGNNIKEGLIDDKNEENTNKVVENQEPIFSDFMVASIIETIEFVLGTVSNTASYLRLWALSLAHSQLSVVFFSKSLGYVGTFSQNPIINGILLSFIFVGFACITIAVLLFMDLMECALHTLRLHWVEFQNKFYRADGYQFKPFCFSQSLNLNIDQVN